MEILYDIPEKTDESFKIIDFHLRVGSKVANVTVEYMGRRDTVPVNFQSVIDAATATQKTIVKQFFKRIGLIAGNLVGVTLGATEEDEASVSGDLFDDV